MALPYPETYYKNTLKYAREVCRLEGSETVDVCVVGGGLAGLSTALGLAERGKKVALIEANRIGWGASGRNGGFVAKGYACAYKKIAKKVGLSHAKELAHLSLTMQKEMLARIDKYKIDCGPVKKGVMGVSWYKNPSEVRDYVDYMNENFDAALEFMPQDQVRSLFKSEKYYDGFLAGEGFQFHPLNYVYGLAKTIEDLGGLVFEDTKATKIRQSGSGYVVQTPKGQIKASEVVLSCSIYVNGLEPKLKNAAFPVYTFVMVTKPIDADRLKQAIDTEYANADNRFAQDYYRVLPDNRILWGGRVSVSGTPDNLAEIMIRDLLKVYPQLKGAVEAEYAWGGALCYAPHKMPQIGQIQPGYWYNTCFGGHGLVPTAVGGDVVASAIADGDERYKLFEPFSKLNFAGGPAAPYVAQSVYYAWRGRDIIKEIADKMA